MIWRAEWGRGLSRRETRRHIMDTAIKAEQQKPFLPAAGHDFLLPFYDLIAHLMGADLPRSVLVQQAGLTAGQRVLDIGCGTGTDRGRSAPIKCTIKS